MFRWTYIAAVLGFWGASMGWLVSTKIIPHWRNRGTSPHASEITPIQSPLTWTILWSGREVGWSTTRTELQIDGSLGLHHELELKDLSVLDATRELLGPMAHLLAGGSHDRLPNIDLRITSDVRFDLQSRLRSFSTSVDVSDLATVMRLEGEVRGSDLEVIVFAVQDDASNAWREFLRRTVHFPPSASLADAFTPPSQYSHLEIGDEWTLPVYRVFPPNDPIQMVRAIVEEDALIEWNGSLVSTKVVVFRPDVGQGPTVSQQPISRMWIREDGTVLQQEAHISRAVIRFVRRPSEAGPNR